MTTVFSPPAAVERPGGITLIMVLALINAVFAVIGGIWIIVDRANHPLLNHSNLTENGL